MRKSQESIESEDARCASSVPISIKYVRQRNVHTYGDGDEEVYPGEIVSCEREGDIVFVETFRHPLSFRHPRDETKHMISMERIELDAYQVRADFETAKTESEIRQFLNSAGRFLPLGSTLTMSEFREWQEFIKLLRRDDFRQVVSTDPRAREASLAIYNLTSAFFGAYERAQQYHTAETERIVRNSPEQTRKRTQEAFAEAQERETKRRRALMDYIREPPAYVRSRLTPEAIQSFERGNRQFPPTGPEQKDIMPVLVFKPTCALEAIAATIAADRLRGIRHRVCDGCKRLFIRKKRSQKYCGGTSCKDKARTKRRTEADSKAREFYMEKRRAGLDREGVLSLPEASKFSLTPRVIERAEKALAKKKRSPAR